jgi:polyadenylate-binding protein 2
MKKRLKEIEEEASALREMQAKVEKEMGAVQGFILIMLFNFRRFDKFLLLIHCLFNSDLFIIWLNYWFFKLFEFLILDPAGSSVSQAEKEEVDARSIYVGNVSFAYL